jgi:hypothetical protein
MMTPGQTSAQGTVLLVEHRSSTIMRMAAHVFDLPQGGIAYLDLGWSDPLFSGHADHILTGALNDAAGYQPRQRGAQHSPPSDNFEDDDVPF